MGINHQIKTLNKGLKKKKLKISIAESCSGGLISYNLTKLPGSSQYFKMGVVCYSNESKIKFLKVKKKKLLKYGAVSMEICKQMCKNLLKISKSNIAVSITGIAGPGGSTVKKPVGLVYIGIASKKKIEINKFIYNKKLSRVNIQKKALKSTLKIINDHIAIL
ncbi:MAG: CinA family protein [Candidatus Fonsibacter sp.]